jgi:hypothetical protein
MKITYADVWVLNMLLLVLLYVVQKQLTRMSIFEVINL